MMNGLARALHPFSALRPWQEKHAMIPRRRFFPLIAGVALALALGATPALVGAGDRRGSADRGEERARPKFASEPLPRGAVLRLGSSHFRAEGKLTSLALSPDGRLLAG